MLMQNPSVGASGTGPGRSGEPSAGSRFGVAPGRRARFQIEAAASLLVLAAARRKEIRFLAHGQLLEKVFPDPVHILLLALSGKRLKSKSNGSRCLWIHKFGLQNRKDDQSTVRRATKALLETAATRPHAPKSSARPRAGEESALRGLGFQRPARGCVKAVPPHSPNLGSHAHLHWVVFSNPVDPEKLAPISQHRSQEVARMSRLRVTPVAPGPRLSRRSCPIPFL